MGIGRTDKWHAKWQSDRLTNLRMAQFGEEWVLNPYPANVEHRVSS